MIVREEPKPADENDPSVQIRTDLWNTMSIAQLNRQRDLMIDKITKIQSLMGVTPNPSIVNMHSALQLGLTDVTKLIDYKAAQKK